MKFPSLRSLTSSFAEVVTRFPLEMAFTVCGTASSIVLIEVGDRDLGAENITSRLLTVSVLGLALALSATLFSERRQVSGYGRSLARGAVVLLVVLFFFLLDPVNRETDVLRFLMLALSFHLLVSFAGFTGKSDTVRFWQFNKTLFLRFLTGALYSAVLFIGLSAAIGSLNLLFNLKFDGDTFAILWVLIAGLFQTVFFLSGLPSLKGNYSDVYPNGLKVFTQYVLIPLASVYAVILLSYEAKILMQLELPKGLVSSLIAGYAVFGILSLLLVYPIKDREENRWIKTYTRSFYYILIPLIALLLWAVLVRVADYGLTEERYILLVLALWLAFTTAYFLFSDQQDIRIIPGSLCLIVLLTVYGPQSAFDISRRSQLSELRKLFAEQQALDGAMLRPLKDGEKPVNTARIVNIIGYLVNKHDFASLSPLLKPDLTVVQDSILNNLPADRNRRNNKWELRSRQTHWVFNYLNIKDTGRYGMPSGEHYTFEADDKAAVPLSRADFLIEMPAPADTINAMLKGKSLTLKRNGNRYTITYQDKIQVLELDSLVSRLHKNKHDRDNSGTIPVAAAALSSQIELNEMKLKFIWNRLTFDDSPTIISAQGYLLVTFQ